MGVSNVETYQQNIRCNYKVYFRESTGYSFAFELEELEAVMRLTQLI